jgi:hypothetical protein
MIRFMQYMSRPMPTRMMSVTWSSHSRSLNAVERPGGSMFVGRGSSLYHETADGLAQRRTDVKKLSKQSESAAAHAQMNMTSKSVCASLCDVRQSPSGRPKYSSCGHVSGAGR